MRAVVVAGVFCSGAERQQQQAGHGDGAARRSRGLGGFVIGRGARHTRDRATHTLALWIQNGCLSPRRFTTRWPLSPAASRRLHCPHASSTARPAATAYRLPPTAYRRRRRCTAICPLHPPLVPALHRCTAAPLHRCTAYPLLDPVRSTMPDRLPI
ncbi:hypothetical protein P280DRAFT_520089 [Massarina eburnea CBS 473.64]|uniref:Uncharacterized protein n=1 Tax=Massarina eburnea CBS 473.64 TaxID=1395130 RepID=A0A6A6RSR2_9PLEO|nr:hypothetical protein P280DRAFT_520089 [Massarina eburnea CBS 473.64]